MKMRFISLLRFLAVSLVAFNGVGARAEEDCSPRVRAAPSYMACTGGDLHYMIEFQTMMSSPKTCPFEKHVEVTTAVVGISGADGKEIASITILPGYFRAERNLPGEPASFTSEALHLDLKDCSIPAHGGGLSGGNR